MTGEFLRDGVAVFGIDMGASFAGEYRREADFGIAGRGGFFYEINFIEFSFEGWPNVAFFELSSSK